MQLRAMVSCNVRSLRVSGLMNPKKIPPRWVVIRTGICFFFAVAMTSFRGLLAVFGAPSGRRGLQVAGGLRLRPADVVLDDPALQRVAGDAEHGRGFDDRPGHP